MGDTSLTDAEFTYSSPNMCVSDSLLSSGTYSTQSLWPFWVIIYSYRNETAGWGFLVGSERQAVLVGFTECDTHIVELSYLGKSSVAPVSGVPWRQCFGGSVATTQAILKDMSNTRSRADCLYMGDCEESDTLKVLYSLLKTWSRNRKFLWHWRIFYLLQLQDWHNKFIPDSTSSGFSMKVGAFLGRQGLQSWNATTGRNSDDLECSDPRLSLRLPCLRKCLLPPCELRLSWSCLKTLKSPFLRWLPTGWCQFFYLEQHDPIWVI